MEIYIVVFLLIILNIVTPLFLKYKFSQLERREIKLPPQPQPIIKVDLHQTEKLIEQIPNKVLQSITSSSNGYKGSVGELIGYLKLSAEFDRVIPLGDIVDFLGIKYPTDTEKGNLIFIDIKTGNARLSKSQKLLKDIIDNKQIEFRKYHIGISDLSGKVKEDDGKD